jgi:parallel beta-helix repeat protein
MGRKLRKKVALALIAGWLLGCIFASSFNVQSFGSEHATIVVPDDFHTIQEAINNAGSGDTIYVKAGIYQENIVVNKSISLIGEDKYNTVIDGSKLGIAIEITASNVSIGNLTVRDSGSSIEDSGIWLSGVENCSINGNVVTENGNDGIMVYQSVGNAVIGNMVAEAGQSGIILYGSNNNTISENDVQNASRYGIALQSSLYCQVTGNIVTDSYEGIVLLSSNRNSVSCNTVKNSTTDGIRLDDPSDYNNFTENTVANNGEYGFWMWYSSNNLFYHNLCNNTNNVLVLSAPEQGYNSTNAWDNGYPSGGNYWSDYNGQDLYSGPYQNETGSDGIGDTPYIIDKYNIDRYPLMLPASIENPLPVHNLDTGLLYSTIQEAIDAPETVDTNRILVNSGTYYENIVVTKAIELIGESEETTIVDGGGQGTVMELSANNITVTGFTLRNSGTTWAESGIALSPVSNCNVSGNDITNNQFGVWAESSTSNIISGNNFSNDGYGIALYDSSNGNSISDNNVTTSAHAGILLPSSMENEVSRNNITDDEYGVELVSSSNNTIVENYVANNSHGIALYESSNYNEIVGNTIQSNGWGFETDTSANNTIYHNNFIDNTPQVFFYESGYSNVWDMGYPEGGNYWSDQNSTDFHSGPYQNETGSDGIADAPYSIDSYNEDHYPLMGMFYDFAIHLTYPTGSIDYVNVISNSTVLDLYYLAWPNSSTQYLQQGQLLILFSVEKESGTAGFCLLMIPRTALNASTYTVFVDGNPVNAVQLRTSNDTMVYLYFTYTDPEHEIIVTIPESSLTIVLALAIATTSVISLKRKGLIAKTRARSNKQC